MSASVLGPRPKLMWIKLAQLTVDSSYQRGVKKDGRASVGRMAREFSWRRCGALNVAPIAGDKYAVIDGQHRLLAAAKRGDIAELPCYVVDSPDVVDQATSFVSINRDRIQVGRLDQYHAAVAARDTDALRIQRLCKAAGITVARQVLPELPPCTTTATVTLRKILDLVGLEVATEALKLLREGQEDCNDAFRSAPIAAMARIVGLYGDKLDRKRMVLTLRDLDLEDETSKAKGYRAAAGGTLEDALVRVLVRAYNKRGRAGALLEPGARSLKAVA